MKRFILFILFFLPAVFALPQELENLSYAIAFIGGLLMFFAPCSYALVPAYLAVTFREKSSLVKSTLILFLGFISTFGFIAIGLSLIGRLLNIYSSYLIKVSGILFIVFGILSLLGISFGNQTKYNKVRTPFQIFIFGALFALGFAACTGPVFYAILTLSANLSTTSSIIFVMFYSMGLFAPLLLASYFFDKINFSKLNWINKSVITIKSFDIKIWNIVSFLLFTVLGVLFLFYGGTAPLEYGYLSVTDLDYRSTYGFLLDTQTRLLESGLSNMWLIVPGLILLIAIAYKNRKRLKKWLSRFS